MTTVRRATAHFLASKSSIHTRRRYKKDIVTWQKYCQEAGTSALDGSIDNAQGFFEYLSARYTTSSAISRFSGVRNWFDCLLENKIIKGHGFRETERPTLPKDAADVIELTDEQLEKIVSHASARGPRWEWIVMMVAYCGVDAAEALRVRSTDVSTTDGRTVVRLISRRGTRRELVVHGRLELLTLGLASVFAPTTRLGGPSAVAYEAERRSDYTAVQVGKIASQALDMKLTLQHLRRNAVLRQYRRGVQPEIIAKWLGHTTDRWVRHTLGLPTSVAEVTASEVEAAIVGAPHDERTMPPIEPDLLTDDAS